MTSMLRSDLERFWNLGIVVGSCQGSTLIFVNALLQMFYKDLEVEIAVIQVKGEGEHLKVLC